MKKDIYSIHSKKKDRNYIIENSKKSYKEFLLEVEGGQSYLERCKNDTNLPIYLVGIIQKGDTPNRNGRIYPFDILKKECDRYLNEEIKDLQSYGECFTSNDFEVLTENGWKHFNDLFLGENVITRNDNGIGEYKSINSIINMDYSGKVYKFKGLNIDTEVTANHKFLIKNRNGIIEKITAEEIYNNRTKYSHSSIIKSIQWNGEEKENIILPAILDYKGTNKLLKEKYSKELIIDSKIFCSILGIYLAEGCTNKSSVIISQNEGNKANEILELIKLSGLDYHIYNKSVNKKNKNLLFYIDDLRLVNYLNLLGNVYNKFIPKEIKQLSSEYLGEILYWFNIGDGRKQINKNGNKRSNVFTVSKQLINDLHECWFKYGKTGNLTIQNSKEDYLFDDHIIEIKNKKPLHQLNMSSIDNISLDKRFLSIEENEFNGKVYCLNVKDNHNFYIRQNNKHFWTCNCDHPEDSTVPELKNACWVIVDIWYKGTEVWGKLKLLNAYMPPNAPGNVLRGIILNGCIIGISSRALGSVYQNGSGFDIVDDDLEIICWDAVSRPSTFNANLRVLDTNNINNYNENKSIKNKNGKLLSLTESVCFGENCNIETSKKIIKEKELKELSSIDKTYLSIMGVEKFLQNKYKK